MWKSELIARITSTREAKRQKTTLTSSSNPDQDPDLPFQTREKDGLKKETEVKITQDLVNREVIKDLVNRGVIKEVIKEEI